MCRRLVLFRVQCFSSLVVQWPLGGQERTKAGDEVKR